MLVGWLDLKALSREASQDREGARNPVIGGGRHGWHGHGWHDDRDYLDHRHWHDHGWHDDHDYLDHRPKNKTTCISDPLVKTMWI